MSVSLHDRMFVRLGDHLYAPLAVRSFVCLSFCEFT